MTLSLLPSDIIVWILFFGFIVSVFWIVAHPHWKNPWKRVFEKNIGMIACVVLSFYVVIGLLDSIHFINAAFQQKSVLDFILGSIGTHAEKTYSAPFATTLFQLHTKTPLQYVDLHFVKQFLIGLSFGVITFSVIGFICYRFIFSKKTKIAWKAAIITFGILWILFSVLLSLGLHAHILGTSKIGTDIFYETLKSIRTGLFIGTVTTIVMLPFALLFGTMAGYFSGWIDDVIQYLYTTLSSIPGVLLITAAVLVMQVFIGNHPNLFPTLASRADARLITLCIILGITSWASLCRLLRAETLKLREQEFVTASIAMGAKKFPIIFRHIFPNVMHIVIITIVLDFSSLVLAEAILSYVGVGVDPTMPSFGNIINTSRLELAREPAVWWPLLSALIVMFFLVLSANLFADQVRDAFDPRTN